MIWPEFGAKARFCPPTLSKVNAQVEELLFTAVY
jgi:hypothetical protein